MLGDEASGEVFDRFRTMQRWYAEQVATLLDRLDAIPEGDGTVLDHTIVLWGNELGHPAGHSSHAIPMVVAGGGGLGLRTGRWLRLRDHDHPWCHGIWGSRTCTEETRFHEQVPHNKLLLSILHRLGQTDVPYFGAPDFASHPDYQGTLPGL